MDENNNIKQSPNVPPFVRYCSAIIPTAFDDSLSYYEALCALWKWLQDNVVNVINNNATVTDEYIKLVKALEKYVHDYFDNLDVQEEINNKLDAMVEDGTMAQIIEGTVFPNILLMLGDTTNPIHYGADPTGTEDSTQAINDCIEANKGGVVNFTSGTYLISDSIELPYENEDKVSINGNGARIKAGDDITSIFVVGSDRPEPYVANNVGFVSYIKDLYIDGEGQDITYAFYINKGFKDLKLENITTWRTRNGVLIGEVTGAPADVLISKCLFYGDGSEYDGTGVISNCSDNNIEGSRIYGFRKGFYVSGYITIIQTQVLLRWENQTTENFNPYPVDGQTFKDYYTLTMFADCDGPCKILGSYCDSMMQFLYIDTQESIIVDNCFCFNARGHVDQHWIDINKVAPKLNVTNSQFCLSEAVDADGVSQTFLRKVGGGTFTNFAQLTFNGIQTTRIQYISEPVDILLSGISVTQRSNINCTADTWYVAGIIGNWSEYSACDINFFNKSWKYDLHILDNGGGSLSLAQTGGDSTQPTNYTIGVFIENNALYICYKQSTSGNTKMSCELHGQNNMLFNIPPVKGDSIQSTNRALSNFTNSTPTKVLTLNQALGISTGTNP